MLKELLTTALLTFNIGGNTNFKATKKNAAYTETISLTASDYTQVGEYTNYNDNTLSIIERKYNVLNTSNIAHIIGNLYATDYEWYITSNTPQNYDSERKNNTTGYILQISPYTTEESATGTLTINISLDLGYNYNQIFQCGYSIMYFITDEGNLNQLLNMQNWQGQNWRNMIQQRLPVDFEYIGPDQILKNNQNDSTTTINRTLTYNGTSRVFYIGFYISQLAELTCEPTQLNDPPAIGECKLAKPTASIQITFPNAINYEVVDIPGMVLQIITMPFTFVSTAFNLTIFPGTPYQINLANLFMTLFAVLVFAFLLKIILGKA